MGNITCTIGLSGGMWRVSIYRDGQYITHKYFSNKLVAECYGLIVDNCKTISVAGGKILLRK